MSSSAILLHLIEIPYLSSLPPLSLPSSFIVHPDSGVWLMSVPVSRTRRYMKQGRYAKIIQQGAAVYLGEFPPLPSHFVDIALTSQLLSLNTL
jgi:hypothetical protein